MLSLLTSLSYLAHAQNGRVFATIVHRRSRGSTAVSRVHHPSMRNRPTHAVLHSAKNTQQIFYWQRVLCWVLFSDTRQWLCRVSRNTRQSKALDKLRITKNPKNSRTFFKTMGVGPARQSRAQPSVFSNRLETARPHCHPPCRLSSPHSHLLLMPKTVACPSPSSIARAGAALLCHVSAARQCATAPHTHTVLHSAKNTWQTFLLAKGFLLSTFFGHAECQKTLGKEKRSTN
jgi:hypothetical protein